MAAKNLKNYAFKLFAQDLTEAVTITTTTQELALEGQTVNMTVAAGVSGVATLPEAPVGLVVVVTADNVNSTGDITLTDPKGTTYAFDADNDSVTLMAVDSSVNTNGDYYIVLSNTSVTVS